MRQFPRRLTATAPEPLREQALVGAQVLAPEREQADTGGILIRLAGHREPLFAWGCDDG